MRLLNRIEILKSLGIGKTAFYAMVKEAGLKPYKPSKNSHIRLFDMDAITAYIEEISEGMEEKKTPQHANIKVALAVRADMLREKKGQVNTRY